MTGLYPKEIRNLKLFWTNCSCITLLILSLDYSNPLPSGKILGEPKGLDDIFRKMNSKYTFSFSLSDKIFYLVFLTDKKERSDRFKCRNSLQRIFLFRSAISPNVNDQLGGDQNLENSLKMQNSSPVDAVTFPSSEDGDEKGDYSYRPNTILWHFLNVVIGNL